LWHNCGMTRLAAICSLPAALLLLAGRPPAADFPRDLDSYFTKYVKLDAAMRAQLLAGAPVTKLLDSDASKEVVVFGAVWIDAPVERYLAAVRDIERFESGGNFRITKKISSPPAPAGHRSTSSPSAPATPTRPCSWPPPGPARRRSPCGPPTCPRTPGSAPATPTACS